MGSPKTVKCACAGRAVLGGTVVLLLAATGAGATPDAALSQKASDVSIAFGQRSYRPGEPARLRVWSKAEKLQAQFFRVGFEHRRTRRSDEMVGEPVGRPREVRGQVISLRAPAGPSGLYFVRVTTPTGAVGFAPFVLRPRRSGLSRVLVVMPTNTWQAYNRRDVDGNGLGDTWYEDASFNGVDLTRPYLDRGVPPHFTQYDLGFLRWLARSASPPDVVADDDLERLSGADLARLYDLVVFPGHEEYVTEHAWNAVWRYRDLGGNLAFLSANNFFYRVVRRGSRLYRAGRWRDLGRSESALTGVSYAGWYEGRYRSRPYVVTGARTASWLFAGTELRDGDTFGHYGIEVDRRTPASPSGTIVLARIRDIFGPGRSAEMTYYETGAGAKVFAAGVMNFGGSAEWPVVSKLLTNLWRKLARP